MALCVTRGEDSTSNFVQWPQEKRLLALHRRVVRLAKCYGNTVHRKSALLHSLRPSTSYHELSEDEGRQV